MKLIRLFSTALLLCLFVLMIAVAATSFTRAFTQVDTLVKPAKNPGTDTIMLQQISEEKTKNYEAQKDSISMNLDFGPLKDKAGKVNTTLNQTKSNLREVKEKDVQKIDKTYRFDTSPKPVIINVTFPSVTPQAPVKKGLFRHRD